LDPESFAQVSSGIVLIKCAGKAGSGSGFLVGTSVVMTATHVVDGCRSVRVLIKEKRWVGVTSRIDWNDRGSQLDVSTLKLTQSLKDVWVFGLRPSQIPTRAFVAALGHPLGEGLSYSNGRVLGHIPRQQIVMRILGAQGMSGGPVVDIYGRVVGVVNSLFSDAVGAATGAYTADNLVAYDVSSRWAAWRGTLCHTYRFGGIANCPNARPPSNPEPPPPPPPTGPATPGYYRGQITSNGLFNFIVAEDGTSVVDVAASLNESCSPSNVRLTAAAGAPFFPSLQGPIPIAVDGSFVGSGPFSGYIDFPDGRVPTSNTMWITGRFTGATATGTIRIDTTFTHGTAYVCTSGDQTWTASKL
jgi:hypothetical protein